jgi:hypothetical protein
MIHVWVTQQVGEGRIRVTPPYGIRQTTVPVPNVGDPHKAVVMRRIFNSYSPDEKVTVERREEIGDGGGWVWRVTVEPIDE